MTIHQPIIAEARQAPAAAPLLFLSFLTRIQANGRDTGLLHVVDFTVPPGEESPWHVHYAEDESFYVVEGELEVIVGSDRLRLGPGDFAFGPRGIPHGFRAVSTTPVRVLLITVGGGFSDFVAEVSRPAPEGTRPAPAEPDMEKLVAAARKYGMEIFGPLPA